jgi:hypothetical protein
LTEPKTILPLKIADGKEIRFLEFSKYIEKQQNVAIK